MSTSHVAAKRPNHKASFARVGAVAASFLLVSMLIITQSKAAFTATTSDTGNSFSAATIALSDDASVLFTVANMVPGDTAYGCLTVTYNGGVDPAVVKVYSGGYTDTGGGDLGNYLDLTIKQVGAGTCDGTLSGTAIQPVSSTIKTFALLTNYAGGVGTWDPATNGDSQRYQVIVTLNSSTPDAQQGAGVSDVLFTWETQAGT